eukprot:3801211-Pleurochrysis_carterae.AAC.1
MSSESLKKQDTGRRVSRVQNSKTDTGVMLREPSYAPWPRGAREVWQSLTLGIRACYQKCVRRYNSIRGVLTDREVRQLQGDSTPSIERNKVRQGPIRRLTTQLMHISPVREKDNVNMNPGTQGSSRN